MSKSPDLLCGAMPAAGQRPLKPFDEGVLAFLSDLSALLLKDKAAKPYPDVVTFAFFCRRANLEGLRRAYGGQGETRLGLGVCFHIAPSNVPVNFAYSLAASLLAGNANVVKASSKNFPQTAIISRAMKALFEGKHAALAPYGCVVTYPREEQALTERFSAACDVRVIWGGDETVRRVREAPLPPRAFDVTFADRYSLLCLRADAILDLSAGALATLAQGFYNDTLLTDQNACTSPRLLYWVGGKQPVLAAKERFWAAAHAYAASRYPVEPVVAVDKLTAACRAAVDLPHVRFAKREDNLILRVETETLVPGLEGCRSPGGFFVEYEGESLDALIPLVTPRYQTLSYVGFDPGELLAFVADNGLRGIDRITPVGHTMDFSLTWDGRDLIRTLSRRVTAM